ncbi:VanZ family protein [Bacillus cereus]|uniref:Teicoplanin resistance protein VanZ n=1 Tax=Bacillus anthracis TaxID=1392 RepID=A0A0J1KDK2_BACAN|nr:MULTISPECIES: VanZ family protein [Bacillus]KLV14550.1 teicoplanin resistance protein VanZ [Bacillus anthracis]MCU4796877.1 VanZ family protein [Bacillus cereus]MCU5530466.1 VanZ family protein [Bacillus cereus]MDA1612754.1 VanZ family protein [Bacillus cereus]MDA2044880.1 VanZ family protein [Bacillus cereus]
MTIEKYIKSIVQKTNLSQSDKDELYFEIYDHLTSLKQEFLDQGKSQEEATTLAIQNFGEASTLGTEIEKAMQSSTQKYVQWIGWGLFLPYSFVLLFKLLLGRSAFYFGNLTYFFETGDWHSIHGGLINLVPFRSTIRYLTEFDSYNIDIVLMNTLGNVIIFIPFGFLLPLLFKQINNVKMASKIFIKFILLIESLQLLTFTGVFDIDDIMLNMLGALIGYGSFVGMKYILERVRSVDKVDTI